MGPNCRCRAHVGGRAIRSYEATKFKQDTQGCQKNLFQVISYLLLLLPVQFIHATENNCKEISQDRMHHHVWKTAKLNDLSNCLFFILQNEIHHVDSLSFKLNPKYIISQIPTLSFRDCNGSSCCLAKFLFCRPTFDIFRDCLFIYSVYNHIS